MKSISTLCKLALAALFLVPGLVAAQDADAVGEVQKVQLSGANQAYVPEETGSATRAYQAQVVERQNLDQERQAKADQKYYRGLEKEAKKEERDAKRVEREILKAEKAEKEAIKARARADRQHQETRNAIDRYIAEN